MAVVATLVVFAFAVLPRIHGDPVAVVIFTLFFLFMSAFFAVPVMMIVLIAGFLCQRGPTSQIAGYTAFASRVNGELITYKLPFFNTLMPRAVVFTHRDVPCVMDMESVRSGKQNRTFTRLTFEWPRREAFACQVVPQGMLSFVTNWFGSQDVRLGWEPFDDAFIVKTDDEAAVPSVLTRPVLELLLQLREFASDHQPPKEMGSGYVECSIRANQVQVRMRGYLLTADDLLTFYQLGSTLFDQLDSAGAATKGK